jgi:uncharacterized protein (DUF1015 family)
MAIVKPFNAIRPTPSLAHKVASLPYDVMNTIEAKEMAKDNPFSFLHVSRAEIDLVENTDVHSPEVYQKARQNFDSLIADNVLVQDFTPCYYVYTLTMHGRVQNGLVACSSIDDYFNNVIKKHEYTRPEKELDRIEHMRAVEAHVGPIFLTYPSHKRIDNLILVAKTHPAIYDFVAEDDIRHQVWVIENSEIVVEIENIFNSEVTATYIADGHHRTASAAKVGMELRSLYDNTTDPYNYFLCVLFASHELAIMDYNRLIKDLNGKSVTDFLTALSAMFDIEKVSLADAKPSMANQFGMYIDGAWYLLIAKTSILKTDPIGVLDVSLLQDNVLSPLLNIQDPRTSDRIDFVGGIRGLSGLQKRVDSGEMAVAFALYPVSIEQLITISDSGNVMPPKSTWFEPKLRDGLFSHLFKNP